MRREPLSPLPAAPVLSEAKVLLGGHLFHDPILSRRQTLACSSCHDLATGGTVRVKRTIGYEGRMHAFNAPTIFNVGNNYRLGWRGKHTSLEVQNENVLLDANLMANDWETLIPRLSATPYYRMQFISVYGSQPHREAVLDALVAFQRSLVTPNAPFDRFLQGEHDAITPRQRYGYKLFKEYGCVSCHQGSNVGGNMFQIFGLFANPATVDLPAAQPPQWPLSAVEQDQETFRVPSLRNVEVTAPYFHDGRAETLDDAVSIMAISQLGRELATDEIDAIVSFLKSLTGDYNGKRLETSVHKDRR
ncbi:cytochrome-c peroxidase [Rhizobium halophilum]|uniref:cytochrome-c peroxidase n=1 Tax=Rhizobium halophilum TaxID=2846852 RepID=UPI001EFCD14F|nr:cytochrome c peroxidase [Rhizobium halophilum]MCF6371139.1 c-type cytochrome [Rhizobium halophilum]